MNTMRQWYVVYTAANAEKKFAEQVNRLQSQCEAYLPLIEQNRQWSDRNKIIHVPLFKSYVFVYLDGNEFQIVKRLAGFVNYIKFNGLPAILAAQEIQKIKTLTLTKSIANAMANRLVKGQRVEIIGGSLQGYQGTLIESRNQKYVAIEVQGLEQSILVTVPIDLLKVVEEA